MKRLLALMLLVALPVQAKLVVIANPNNKLDRLAREEVQDIFMGRMRSFPNGNLALPIDQSSALRAVFYESLTGRNINQINAYWARIVFTGQMSPPLQVADDEAILKAVRANEGAIGYIDESRLDTTVRVLLELPDAQ